MSTENAELGFSLRAPQEGEEYFEASSGSLSGAHTMTQPIQQRENEQNLPGRQLCQGSRSNYTPLCEKCSRINFEKLFRVSKGDHWRSERLSKMLDAMKTSPCPICQQIVQRIHAACQASNIEPPNGNTEVHVKLKSYPISNSDLLDRHMAKSYRCTIDVYWYRDRLFQPPQRIWLPEEQGSWELTGGPLAKLNDNGGWQMTSRPVQPKVDFDWIREWLDFCRDNHTHIFSELKHGGRAIRNVARLASEGHFRLFDVLTGTVVEMKQVPRFFALSYVWGHAMNDFIRLVTDSNNHNTEAPTERPRKINLTSAPDIIADVANLLEALDERYIWIDAICLDQGQQAEKMLVIPRMGDIYQCAFATIVVASGDSANGIAGVTANRHVESQSITFAIGQRNMSLCRSRPSLHEALTHTTWGKRGWTYQERQLSKRCIYFLKDEVFCSCPQGIVREAYVGHWQQSEPIDWIADLKGENTWNYYAAAVSNFSGRQLGNNGDRLNAFMGVLDQLYSPINDSTSGQSTNKMLQWTICGSPATWFLGALLWEPADSSEFKRIPKDAAGTMGFPSWSWIGYTAGVRFHPLVTEKIASQGDFRALDEYNFVIGPTSYKRSAHLEWQPWPQGGYPKPFDPGTARSASVHLWVPVIRCFNDDSGGLLAAGQGTITHELRVGYLDGQACSNGLISSWCTKQATSTVYDVMILPAPLSKDLVPGLLIEQQDKFAIRLPVACAIILTERAQKFWKYQYICLR